MTTSIIFLNTTITINIIAVIPSISINNTTFSFNKIIIIFNELLMMFTAIPPFTINTYIVFTFTFIYNAIHFAFTA